MTETDYVCVSAAAFAQLTTKLQRLEIANQRLTLVMATAGHDLRQRLHLLMGTVNLLTSSQEQTRSDELSQRAKSIISRLAGELEQLALQAEGADNCGAPVPCAFAMSGLLNQLKSDWQSEAEAKGLNFKMDQTNDLVNSDQRLLTVILNNVIANAVRHTERGGIKVTSSIQDRCLLLSVSDTGPGISDEDLRRSFSLTTRLRGFNQGMGLGLSIARKSAEVLGHEFDVLSTGGGTCVRLHIPLASTALLF